MEQISRDDRLILQLIERLTRVETKLDTMLVTLEKSNERFTAIDESFIDLTDRVTKVESEASRANLRLDESQATIVKVGTITSTVFFIVFYLLWFTADAVISRKPNLDSFRDFFNSVIAGSAVIGFLSRYLVDRDGDGRPDEAVRGKDDDNDETGG